MNEQIEDERGLMKKLDFKKMFYTSFGRGNEDKKKIIYEMLLPLIRADDISISKERNEGGTPIFQNRHQ